MAVIKKYEEKVNPDGQTIQYQQSVSITGASISDEILLPPVLESGFTFSTDGTGTIEVSMSSQADIIAGSGVWVDNDLINGPAFSTSFPGTFRGISGIRINNASGTSTINIISK